MGAETVRVAAVVASGRWQPPMLPEHCRIGVVSGAVLHAHGEVPDLLLAGDLSEVAQAGDERWRVVSIAPAVIAMLTPTAAEALTAVPGATERLLASRHRQHQRERELRAVVGIHDIRRRVERFFAFLARHVGQAEADGVRIPLCLEQRRVEELVCAGHTQATSAFRSLFASGTVQHDGDGWWYRNRSAPNTIVAPELSTLPIGARDQ